MNGSYCMLFPKAAPEQPYRGQGTGRQYLCLVPMALHEGLLEGSDIVRIFRGGYRCPGEMTIMDVAIPLII
jgi:hypothetical protein